MKLKEIHRTSTFAWSPSASLPLLATGTVAGALDESFSNESQLEIWAPDFLDQKELDLGYQGQHGPKGFVTDNARFNRLAWGAVDAGRPLGVIAAGMENGELALWDPAQILAGESAPILRKSAHTGSVRGLEFNPIATNLLASGGVAGEVSIWDLKDPSKPYTPTPGSRSTKLDEITSVAWNQQVQSVLAGASSTGYTVVWDLRGKREVVALAYGGGAGTLAGQQSGSGPGGRRGMSDIAWHPDNATRLVTASEDDASPIIMVWDLRNARAPEKILTGHEKGVLSLSWCKQDADLLLSCGKDNRALCWNPQTSEVIGELPPADNWAFQVDWCPRNPDLLATAFFDGTVGIHSIQSTNESTDGQAATAPGANGADLFDVPGFTRSSPGSTLSLKQTPKWLKRPISAGFGFGGKLLTVSNLPSAQGKNQSNVVHLRKVVTEDDLVARSAKLQAAIDGDSLKAFADEKSGDSEGWKALRSIFQADSRDELVALLGFSKEEIAVKVQEAVEKLKSTASATASPSPDEERTHEPVVSFAEPEHQEDSSDGEKEEAVPESAGLEKTPSEFSATSDATSAARLADGESTTTAPSLFGDDAPGTPQDFFSTLSEESSRHTLVPHTNYGLDSSVAATIGSRPSSVTSEATKVFHIYPRDSTEVETLVTKALVIGDFESAVSLCLSADRFADAILLAVKGGPELLARTQKTYFERSTTSASYLRLFQSITSNDLSDIVQNADLREWQEIFVVLCTFASKEEFPLLAEQLGRRLEFQSKVSKSSEDAEVTSKTTEYRKNATLTYLAAARLERLVGIWLEELAEEEEELSLDEKYINESRSTTHAHALQTFIEKVTVFRSATKYTDSDLNQAVDPENHKLAGLYDRYFEYAELLASQGLVKEAATFLKLTPKEYVGAAGEDLTAKRERLLVTTGAAPAAPAMQTRAAAAAASSRPGGYPVGYPSQAAVVSPLNATQTSAYTPYAPNVPATTTSFPSVQQQQQPSQYQPPVSNSYVAPPSNGYTPFTNSLTQPPHLRNQNQSLANRATPPPAPPPKRDNGGWNDAPVVNSTRAPPTVRGDASKPAAITSPFPNALPSPGLAGLASPPYIGGGGGMTSPPPPARPGSVNAARLPPGPGQHLSGPPPGQMYPPVRAPPGPGGMPPPGRMMSPPQQQGPPRQPTPSQYGPPPGRGPMVNPTPPPGQFIRPAPPGQHGPGSMPPPGQPGPYANQGPPGPYSQGPPLQANPAMQHGQPPSGPYAPPPGSQMSPGPQQVHNAGPPPPGGPPGPPGGGPAAARPPPAARAPPAPAAPKYPPGDRSHIPQHVQPAVNVIIEHLNRMKQTTPPQQKRMVDDTERRLNTLLDALNCESLSEPVVEQFITLTRAMDARDRPASLALHVDLLTKGSQRDDIGIWMAGVKQLIMRL